MGEPPLRGMYHAGKPLAHRTPKKNLFGSAATVRPQVFPNEATAFHPWLPQRRVALASAPGPHASCRAAQHGACRWLVSHGIRAPSGHLDCVQVAAATPWTLQSFERLSGRMSNRGQICLSMSSYGECDGPDRVLPALIQLPATKSAYKTRCSVLDVMEASTRLINPLPLDVVLVACHALQMLAAAVA